MEHHRLLSLGARGRLELIDGLRGIAALSVVLFHIGLFSPFSAAIPRPVAAVLAHGDLGVAVFFVLSGFVIAHAIREAAITPEYALNFALRRQLRLDPPYWAMIVFSTIDLSIPALIHRDSPTVVPTTQCVMSHFVYLQSVLHQRNLVPVFWSLCIEVQFYVVFIVVLALVQRISQAGDRGATSLAHASIGLIGVASALYFALVSSVGPWFLSYWFMFVLGALTAWVVEGTLSQRALFAFGVLVLAVGVWRGAAVPFAAAGTALVIWAGARFDRLHTWLRQTPFQYFGKLSYSLYLVHWTISYRILNLGNRLTHGSPGWAFIWISVALIAAVGAAQLLHVAVERPAMRLAASVKSALVHVPSDVTPAPPTALESDV